jgi:A/G-specific adenine glycosylase
MTQERGMQGRDRRSPGNPPPDQYVAKRVLVWYDKNRRRLPWRAEAGRMSDPYHVWLSEIMLQQTTVAAVAPYFERFIGRWPTVCSLARAPLDDVLHAWQGLGYYARARNLHRAAAMICDAFGGRFPAGEAELRALPGVGPYTAAAIAAIAFGARATVVDGNVERVVARLGGIETPLPAARREIHDLAAALTPGRRSGDYAQAMMDLGATVCGPRRPDCGACPLTEDCLGRHRGIAASLPRRVAKAERPTRRGVAFWAVRPDGSVLLRRRPERGLLGGMVEVPSTEWRAVAWEPDEALRHAPFAADWRPVPGLVRHTFTHFHLELDVFSARIAALGAPGGAYWCPIAGLPDQALPTLMKKIVRLALSLSRPR